MSDVPLLHTTLHDGNQSVPPLAGGPAQPSIFHMPPLAVAPSLAGVGGHAIPLPSSDRDFSQFTGAYFVKDSANLFYPRLDIGPCRGQQDDNRQTPICEILLVSHILVSGDQDFVAFLLGLLNQVSIPES